jgi:hypothetical protein
MENKNIEVHALCKALNLRADRFIEIAEACNACRDNKGNLWLIGEEMIQKFTKEAKLPSELPEVKPLDVQMWAKVVCMEAFKYGYRIVMSNCSKGRANGREEVYKTRDIDGLRLGQELAFVRAGDEWMRIRI